MNKDNSVKALEEHIEKLAKEKNSLIRYIDDKIRVTNDSMCDSNDLDDIKVFNTLKELSLTIYKDLIRKIINNDWR